MTNADLSLSIAADRAEIVFDRPGKRNAITSDMWRRIPELVAEAEADAAVKVILIRGEGGAFAAGADISEFETVYATPESAAAYSKLISNAMAAVADCPKPTAAMISGPCVGGGCGLALACDMRFADETSKFAVPPGKLGLAYTLADVKRLIDAVGVSMAKDILYTGRLLDAEEALATGLIDKLFDKPNLKVETAAFLDQVCAASQFSIRTTKKFIRLIRSGQTADNDETQTDFLAAFGNEDFKEGYRAFLEKRKPKFEYS
ncbi:MAG: enoyl-CoA hydratase-related protein [Pseudomonadota bacterium]